MPAITQQPLFRLLLLALLIGSSGGCFNENESSLSVDLGSVSIGQQLIDLERAKESGALSAQEYERVRKILLSAVESAVSESDENDNDDDDDDENATALLDKPGKAKDAAEEDEGFKWF